MRLISALIQRFNRDPLDPRTAAQVAEASLVPPLEKPEFERARSRFGLSLLSGLTRVPAGGFGRGERGQSAPLMAMAMGFLVVMGVMTIDLGLLFDQRREAQAAADFAALAAAQDLPADPMDPQLVSKMATAEATAADYLRRNGFDPADPDVTATITTNFDGVDTIEVVVSRPRSWVFGKIFGLDPIEVQGRAVARADSVPRDIAVVLDRSGSMCEFTHGAGGSCPNPPGDPDGNGIDDWQPFDDMRSAATGFGDNFRPYVDGEVFDRLSIVSYSTDASLDLSLTTDFGSPGSAYETAIDAMAPNGWTNIGHAIYLARQELNGGTPRGAQKVIVLLTDGRANRFLTGGTWDSPMFASCSNGCAAADDDALTQAELAASEGIAIYTIGLTGNAGFSLMQDIANIAATDGPGGQFFDVTDPSDLDEAFTQIAALLGFALIE